MLSCVTMLKHETFPGFAEDVSTFMVNTLLLSNDVVMDHKEEELVKKFISPDLCDITGLCSWNLIWICITGTMYMRLTGIL